MQYMIIATSNKYTGYKQKHTVHYKALTNYVIYRLSID